MLEHLAVGHVDLDEVPAALGPQTLELLPAVASRDAVGHVVDRRVDRRIRRRHLVLRLDGRCLALALAAVDAVLRLELARILEGDRDEVDRLVRWQDPVEDDGEDSAVETAGEEDADSSVGMGGKGRHGRNACAHGALELDEEELDELGELWRDEGLERVVRRGGDEVVWAREGRDDRVVGIGLVEEEMERMAKSARPTAQEGGLESWSARACCPTRCACSWPDEALTRSKAGHEAAQTARVSPDFSRRGK